MPDTIESMESAGDYEPEGAVIIRRLRLRTVYNSDIACVLRIRDYRLFAIGQAVSNTGTWMQRIAQDWLVLQLTSNSGLALGVITVLQCAPVLLFGMWGGLVADRFPKRNVLIFTQFALFIPAAALGLLTAAGLIQPWHVCVLAFGLGLATAFDQPARQAIVVELTGRERLPAAVSVNSLIYNSARLVGPSAAGVVIAGFCVSSGIFLNAVSYLIVVVLVKAMRPATAGEQSVARVRTGCGLDWLTPVSAPTCYCRSL